MNARMAAPVVEAARRAGEHGEFLFLLNHSDTETATVTVPDEGVDLLSGAPVCESFPLAPLAAAVIRPGAAGPQ